MVNAFGTITECKRLKGLFECAIAWEDRNLLAYPRTFGRLVLRDVCRLAFTVSLFMTPIYRMGNKKQYRVNGYRLYTFNIQYQIFFLISAPGIYFYKISPSGV